MAAQKYWQVTPTGAQPVMLEPDELRASATWLTSHLFRGMLVFENYSRAMLCLYELRDNGSTIFDSLKTQTI